jgi:anti-anti-sigma factor
MPPASQGFAIELELGGADLVLRISGELDLSTAPELAAALSDAATGPASTVTLDLSRTSFIDSSALRVLVAGGRELKAADRRLQIGPRSDAVNRVLAMTNLDTHTDAFQLLPDA